ncbi:MAG: hypothetical protein JOZ96_26535 [Acidobacteria bacterium]|nr:hypothetical protein [Acidobacteriota bacterium]
MSEQERNDTEGFKTTGAAKPADPAPPDSEGAGLAPEHERLWEKFLEEFEGHDNWLSEFTPAPFDPSGALRAFVEAAGDAAVPTLTEAASGDNKDLSYWGRAGLKWLEERAEAEEAAAREAYLWEVTGGKPGSDLHPAVALEAADPARARAAGAQRNPFVLDLLIRFYLGRGIEEATEFCVWIIDHEDAATVKALLDSTALQEALFRRGPGKLVEPCLPQLTERLCQLSESHDDEKVRGAAADFLVRADPCGSASKLIRILARAQSIDFLTVERLSPDPDSLYLLKPLMEWKEITPGGWYYGSNKPPGNILYLRELLRRRRCAGLWTDPRTVRPFLRGKLEQPQHSHPYEDTYLEEVAYCVEELRDAELLDDLLEALDGLLKSLPKGRLSHCAIGSAGAFRALGAPALEALRRAAAAPGEYAEQFGWILRATERPDPSTRELLGWADGEFLKGKIEDGFDRSAFQFYDEALRLGPSAHAAFQLAWIDRAFGTEIVPERVEWIRQLGFYDEELLAELSRPAAVPLTGFRTEWRSIITKRERDPARAARAEKAGLPSLAAYWAYEERHELAALEHLDRVWKAVEPRPGVNSGEPAAPLPTAVSDDALARRFIAISDCDICRGLDEYQWALTKGGDVETALPPEASRLIDHELCPVCGTFYQYETSYEFIYGGSEDEEKLTRLTPTQAKSRLPEQVYEAIIRWMPGNLKHTEAQTRRYAAKSMVAHHLARGEAAAIRPYLSHADPAVVRGALEVLLHALDEGAYEGAEVVPELRADVALLESSPDELLANFARGIARYLNQSE